MKQEFPNVEIIINGGIKTLAECSSHLQQVDGVMIGREAYHNPFIMNQVDEMIYGELVNQQTRFDVLESYIVYMEAQLKQGVYLKHMSRHILGLFPAMQGAKAWRRHISENAHKEGAGIEVIRTAVGFLGD